MYMIVCVGGSDLGVAATKKEKWKWTAQRDASNAPTRVRNACRGSNQLKIDRGSTYLSTKYLDTSKTEHRPREVSGYLHDRATTATVVTNRHSPIAPQSGHGAGEVEVGGSYVLP